METDILTYFIKSAAIVYAKESNELHTHFFKKEGETIETLVMPKVVIKPPEDNKHGWYCSVTCPFCDKPLISTKKDTRELLNDMHLKGLALTGEQ